MSSSIEKRLCHVENCLGINAGNHNENVTNAGKEVLVDVQCQIKRLLNSTEDCLNEKSLGLIMRECDKLGKDLSPSGLMLSIDATNSPGSVHRRQEILTRYEELQNAFEKLEQIRDILTISNPLLAKESQTINANGGKNEELSTDRIVSAPILSSSSFTFATDPGNIERLNSVTTDIINVRDRSYNLSRRVDAMIDRYYSVMDTVNEKMVALKEELEKN